MSKLFWPRCDRAPERNDLMQKGFLSVHGGRKGGRVHGREHGRVAPPPWWIRKQKASQGGSESSL